MNKKRKHAKNIEENQPTKIEFCERDFKDILGKVDSKGIKLHLISHSSYLEFKCQECDFWVPNSLSMEMHLKKRSFRKSCLCSL